MCRVIADYSLRRHVRRDGHRSPAAHHATPLSHHLDKLKNEELVTVRREGTYLWYRANTETLKEVLAFLYAECCTRNRVFTPRDIVSISK